MKTAYDYGRETAEWRKQNDPDSAVEQTNLSDDIPSEDYATMKRDGLTDIDERDYWNGFNSAL